jgi:hypothetical protein
VIFEPKFKKNECRSARVRLWPRLAWWLLGRGPRLAPWLLGPGLGCSSLLVARWCSRLPPLVVISTGRQLRLAPFIPEGQAPLKMDKPSKEEGNAKSLTTTTKLSPDGALRQLLVPSWPFLLEPSCPFCGPPKVRLRWPVCGF